MLPMSALVDMGISGTASTLYSSFDLSGDTSVSYTYSNGKYYQGQSPVTASVFYKQSGQLYVMIEGKITSDPGAKLVKTYSADCYTAVNISNGVANVDATSNTIILHIGGANYYVQTIANGRIGTSVDDAYQDIITSEYVTSYSTSATQFQELPSAFQQPQV